MSYAIVAGCVRLFLTLEDDDVIVTEAVCFGTPRLSAGMKMGGPRSLDRA